MMSSDHPSLSRVDASLEGGGLVPETPTDNTMMELQILLEEGAIEPVIEFLKSGVPLDLPVSDNGVGVLHIAAAFGHLKLFKALVDRGATFFPDNEGRWPSTLAMRLGASKSVCDYVLKAEAKALGEDV